MGQRQVSSVDSFHVGGVRLEREAVADRGDRASAVVTAETVEARGWEQPRRGRENTGGFSTPGAKGHPSFCRE